MPASGELRLELLESRMEIHSEDAALLAGLARCFEPHAMRSAAPARPPHLSVGLRRHAAGKRIRPHELELVSDPPEALAGLIRVAPDAPAPLARRLIQWSVEQARLHYVFHAGSVARGGLGLLLPGPSGSGKSTLSVALAQHGMALLSDEVGAVQLENRRLVGFPRALSLRRDVLGVLGLPESIGAPVADEAACMVRASELGLVRQPEAELGLVLLPRYARGSATRLERVEPSAAALALFDASCSQPRFKREGFEFVLDLVQRVPCRALHYSDLAAALAAVDALLRDLG